MTHLRKIMLEELQRRHYSEATKCRSDTQRRLVWRNGRRDRSHPWCGSTVHRPFRGVVLYA